MLCNTEKNLIMDLRMIFVGSKIIRFKDLETNLIGQTVPIGEKSMESLLVNCSDLVASEMAENKYLQNTIIRSITIALSNIF